MLFTRMILAFILAAGPAFAKGRAHARDCQRRQRAGDQWQKVFHIGFDLPPLPEAKAWNGKNGIAELHDAGATFIQTGPGGKEIWSDEAALKREQEWFDVAAKNGMYCWPRLKYVPKLDDAAGEAEFRSVINRFKNHPAMGVWNSVDEPEWSKHPVEPLLRAYRIIRELDPNHPVSIQSRSARHN
jgi:hypothetical protein